MSDDRNRRKKPSLPPSGPKVFVQQPSQHFETITFEEALAQSKGKGLGILRIPDMTPPGWEEFVGIAASDMQTMNVLTELAHRLQHSGEVKEARRQASKKERRQTKLASPTHRSGAPKKYPRAMEKALGLLAEGKDKDIAIYRKCKEEFGAEERIPTKQASFMRRVRSEAAKRRRQV